MAAPVWDRTPLIPIPLDAAMTERYLSRIETSRFLSARERAVLHIAWLVAVPLIPVLFWLFYGHVNKTWVVRAFGCGCHYGFNANHFNAIVGFMILAGAVALLLFASSRLDGWRRSAYLVGGVLVQCFASFIGWFLNLWA